MMDTYDWKQGNLALIRPTIHDNNGWRRAIWVDSCRLKCTDRTKPHWHSARGGWFRPDNVEARPLVVLDMESDEDVTRFYNTWFNTRYQSLNSAARDRARRRLHKLLPTPTPSVCPSTFSMLGATFRCGLRTEHDGQHTYTAPDNGVLTWG